MLQLVRNSDTWQRTALRASGRIARATQANHLRNQKLTLSVTMASVALGKDPKEAKPYNSARARCPESETLCEQAKRVRCAVCCVCVETTVTRLEGEPLRG